jgi:histidine triad (HIT) family protein
MSDCLFCKIASGEIPSSKRYEDDDVLAFDDLYPQAPVHILVIPKEHVACAADITADNSALVSKCFEAIVKLTKDAGIKSYRVITNCGEEAGQTVFHLHFHILAGRKLGDKLCPIN